MPQADRLKSDLIVCIASSVFVFAVSVSTAFSSPVLQVNKVFNSPVLQVSTAFTSPVLWVSSLH